MPTDPKVLGLSRVWQVGHTYIVKEPDHYLEQPSPLNLSQYPSCIKLNKDQGILFQCLYA